jgi:hypothetical protein
VSPHKYPLYTVQFRGCRGYFDSAELQPASETNKPKKTKPITKYKRR